MLIVKLNYQTQGGVFPVLSKYGFQFKGDSYVKQLKSDKHSLDARHDNTAKLLTLSCADEVSFKGCQEIHALLTQISSHLQSDIDDSEAMLGYDSEGKPAYIYHGFSNWKTYINKAKHRSMEGFTVEILAGKKSLGRGILIQADSATESADGKAKTPFYTIISSNGEETFLGDHLTVEPVSDAPTI